MPKSAQSKKSLAKKRPAAARKNAAPTATEQSTLRTKLRAWWWLIPIAIPAIYLIYLLVKYAVNVPFWDEWDMVPLFQKHDAGTLSLFDFWKQHNEHRLLFPQLLIFGLAFLTHWNLAVEVVVNFILAALGFGLVFDMIRRTFAGNIKLIALVGLLTSAIFFSPVQWENWLWGWQIEWYLVVLAVIFTIWTLCFWPQRLARWRLPVAIVSAFIASYSLGSGPFVWFIGLAILLVQKSVRTQLYAWGGAAAVTLASYYYHYSSSAGQPPKSLLLHEPLKFVAYIGGYLGRPLAYSLHTSIAAGLFLILVAAVIVYCGIRYRDRLTDRLLPWYGLAAFGGFSALTTAVSRLGYGVTQSFSNRYFTLSMLFTIAVVVMAVVIVREQKILTQWRWYRYLPIIPAALIILVVHNYGGAGGVSAMAHQSQYLRDIQGCSDNIVPSDLCLRSAYPNAAWAAEQIKYLQHKHWAGY